MSGLVDESIEACRQALEIEPDFPVKIILRLPILKKAMPLPQMKTRKKRCHLVTRLPQLLKDIENALAGKA